MAPPILLLIASLVPAWCGQGHSPAGEALGTVAESSDWRRTATHAEVVDLCTRLAAGSPRIHMEEAGRTIEGRSLPILVIADPPVKTPDEVGDRLVAFAWAGIHSGEVCGKPATLMLARELATTAEHPLLENLVVILLPLLNADGNDRMSPDNRRGQKGPVEGMGTRPNAQRLNINRDFIKLETNEARALAEILTRWDPAIAMDLHTTNGSRHQYVLTYDGPRNPACDEGLRELAQDALLPAVSRSLEQDTGYKSFFYGNFRRANSEWLMYPAQPRYSTHYLGLRNHVGILSEAYSYAEYQDRVMGTLAFVRSCFQYVADNEQAVRAKITAAKERTRTDDEVSLSLRQESVLSEEPVTVLGYAGGRGEPQGEPRAFEARHDYECASTLEVRLPFAYLLPTDVPAVRENLLAHGITVEALAQDTALDVEVYRVASIERLGREYEEHELVRVGVEPRSVSRSFPAGTLVVRTAQELGMLAGYLLEPQSEDGLATWNLFDGAMVEGGDFPACRLLEPAALGLRPVRRASPTTK